MAAFFFSRQARTRGVTKSLRQFFAVIRKIKTGYYINYLYTIKKCSKCFLL